MALFSPAESVYITSFLSQVDLDSSIQPDGSVDPNLADRVPHLQGKEALTKATKDLMSLDIPPPSNHRPAAPFPVHPPPSFSNGPNYWPSIPGGDASASATHRYGPSAVRSSSPANYLSQTLSGSLPSSDPFRSSTQPERPGSSGDPMLSAQPHLQIPPLRGMGASQSPSSGFTLPPISTSGLSDGGLSRPSAAHSPTALRTASPASASASTSTKRPLPSSSQPATDPSHSKRPRPSPSNSPFPNGDAHAASSGLGVGPVRSSSKPRRNLSGTQGGSSKSAAAAAAAQAASAPAPGSGAAAKGTLLSPSQKRANHIQSEQKRRANIRRGYEALCEVVPALREAIRAEEERELAKDPPENGEEPAKVKGKGVADKGGGGKKKKGRGDADKAADGRAGPRSENVVLQKTIDYISDLITERTALQQRLELARRVLPFGHPASAVDPRHLDVSGVPLWEREWNGGMDLDLGMDAGEGSDDES